jgi:hypothetical protein
MVWLRTDVLRQRRRPEGQQPAGLQRHLESSLAGEVLISGFALILVLINVVWNLPPSEIQRRVMPVLEPLAALTGLGQSWAMYAPDPVRRNEVLDVVVTMSDGSKRVWTPTRDDHVTFVVWCHWHKLKETAVRNEDIRAGIASWVVRELTEPAERPVRVEMILRSQDVPPPGEIELAEPRVEALYSESLTGRP